MTDVFKNKETSQTSAWQGKSYVLPFMLDDGAVRGRLVRLGAEFTAMVEKHSYPTCVNQFLGELIAFGATLIMDSKIGAKMTLQITEGAIINMIVAEVTSEGHFRGCATFDAEKLAQYLTDTVEPAFSALFAGGHFVLTMGNDQSAEKHQAIVELCGETLHQCIEHYFSQSDQILTALSLFSADTSVARNNASGENHNGQESVCNETHTIVDLATRKSIAHQLPYGVGALFLQQVPLNQVDEATRLQEEHIEMSPADQWLTYTALLSTLKAEELLSPQLAPETVLHRLFHQHKPMVFPTKSMINQCSCSVERLEGVLKGFDLETLEEMMIDNKIEAGCQFCNTVYAFTRAEIDALTQRI